MLKLKNVISGYKNFKIHIGNLEIYEGQKIAILGPNGSGKSTLIKTLLKMLNYEGSIKLFNKELSEISQKELTRLCSFLLQVEYCPSIKVKTYLNLANIKLKYDIFEISNLLNKKLDELSSGEIQRVRLSRVINSDSKILILDEPLSHLDPYFQIKLLNYLNQINKTVILTIHDIHLAIKYFKDFIIMKNGKIYSTLLNERIFKEVFEVSIDNFL
ncbi:MAG: ATP-binding cassette domain-containing protein [candidate division WOR-3 bacterium]